MLDEELAIKILEYITEGETFGRDNIFNELKKTDKYFNLTKESYMITFNALEENECIRRNTFLPQRGYIIGNPKCLELYKRNSEAVTTKDNVRVRIEYLTAENLRLQNEMLPLQTKDLKEKKKWAFWGGVAGAIFGFLLALLLYYLTEGRR